MIGGGGEPGWPVRLNDVWHSTDGINWTQATANAQWSRRCYHTSVIFDNKMWVIGGGSWDGNDVWYSTDGINWTQATASAGWSQRHNHTSVVFDNKIWVIGGRTGYPNYCDTNDVWYSTGLGVEENQNCKLKIDNFSVFPNPASSYFTIRLPETLNQVQGDKCVVKIFDVSGKTVKEFESFGVDELRVSLDGIKNGVYFVKATIPLSLRVTEGNAAISHTVIQKIIVTK